MKHKKDYPIFVIIIEIFIVKMDYIGGNVLGSSQEWKTSTPWVILRINFPLAYSMLEIWQILSMKASNELYGGLLTTLPTKSRTTL